MNTEISDIVKYNNNYTLLSEQHLIQISSDFGRTKHQISSWNTKPNGTGINYDIESTFKISGDIRLYAQWKEIIEYGNIHYMENYPNTYLVDDKDNTFETDGGDKIIIGE